MAAGRRRITTITGPMDTSGGIDRLDGYRQALGTAVDENWEAHGDYTRSGGSRAMRTLLERVPDLDAVFVASDMMAAGALDVLRDRGRSVPGEVAVTGFDDSGLAQNLQPALTTVNQPLAVISREMVRLLADVIAGGIPTTVTVPTTLVVRDST